MFKHREFWFPALALMVAGASFSAAAAPCPTAHCAEILKEPRIRAAFLHICAEPNARHVWVADGKDSFCTCPCGGPSTGFSNEGAEDAAQILFTEDL